jgi:hypothetical protein
MDQMTAHLNAEIVIGTIKDHGKSFNTDALTIMIALGTLRSRRHQLD